MSLGTPEASAEVVEVTPEQRREEAWEIFKKFIVENMNQSNFFCNKFYEDLNAFVNAHIDVLIEQQHYEEGTVSPYDFIREELATMRIFDKKMERDIFSQIRAVVTHEITRNIVEISRFSICKTENLTQEYRTALHNYARQLNLRELDPDSAEKAGIALARGC